MSSNSQVIARSLIERLETGWNTADGNTFGESFADDADFVDIRGAHHKGKPSISIGHQAIFDSIYKGSTIRYRVESARLLDADTLLPHATAELDAPNGPLQGTSEATCSIVATTGTEGWPIASFHNTLVST